MGKSDGAATVEHRFATENPDPVLRVRRDGVLLFANHASEPLLNLWSAKRLEALPESVAQRLLPSDLDLASAPQGFEVNVAGRAFLLKIVPVAGTEYVNLYGADVTQQRTAELAYRRAKEDAERANLAKTDFLSLISHEMRTPLNAVIGMTELALERAVVGDVRELLRRVQANGEALLAIVGDVLDITSIESGQITLASQPFDPGDLIDRVSLTLCSSANSKGVELICQRDPKLPAAVLGDAQRLQQVLTNLVGNAIKFTERGHVRIISRVRMEQANRCTLFFEVEDTGPGVPENKRAAIFHRFMQVDTSDGRRHGGTGLGLAISQSLVTLMGGELALVESSPSGSRFQVKMPFQVLKPAPPSPMLGGRATLVSSSSALRHAITAIVEGFGVEVVCFSRPAEVPSGWLTDLWFLDQRDMLRAANFSGGGSRDTPIVWLSGAYMPSAAAGGMVVSRLLRHHELLAALSNATGAVTSTLSTANQRSRERALHPKRRVLVIDDNRDARLLFGRILGSAGHDVLEAEGGAAGLAAFEKEQFDVVITDLQMPMLDGFEVATRIRALEAQQARPRCVVIALSAHARTDVQSRCDAADMDAFLSKPVLRPTLLDCVERLTASVTAIPPSIPRATMDADARDALQIDTNDSDFTPDFIKRHRLDVQRLRVCAETPDFPLARRIGQELREAGSTHGVAVVTALGVEVSVAARTRNAGALLEVAGRIEQFLHVVEQDVAEQSGQASPKEELL